MLLFLALFGVGLYFMCHISVGLDQELALPKVSCARGLGPRGGGSGHGRRGSLCSRVQDPSRVGGERPCLAKRTPGPHAPLTPTLSLPALAPPIHHPSPI